MSGENHRFKLETLPIRRRDPDGSRFTFYFRRAHPNLDAIAPRRRDALNVLSRASIDRPPLMLRIETKETVVMKEAQQSGRRKAQHLRWRHAPNRATHRHQIHLEKILAVAPLIHILAQSEISRLRILQCNDRLSIETIDTLDHLQEAPIKQILSLGEYVIK